MQAIEAKAEASRCVGDHKKGKNAARGELFRFDLCGDTMRSIGGNHLCKIGKDLKLLFFFFRRRLPKVGKRPRRRNVREATVADFSDPR